MFNALCAWALSCSGYGFPLLGTGRAPAPALIHADLLSGGNRSELVGGAVLRGCLGLRGSSVACGWSSSAWKALIARCDQEQDRQQAGMVEMIWIARLATRSGDAPVTAAM
jgi:hypothetical protein